MQSWADGFSPPDLPDEVYALLVDGSGNVYAGIDFAKAGGKLSSKVVCWSGRPALAVDFTGSGLSLYGESSWETIEAASPGLIVPYRSSLVAGFPTKGVLQYDQGKSTTLKKQTDAEGMLGLLFE